MVLCTITPRMHGVSGGPRLVKMEGPNCKEKKIEGAKLKKLKN